MTNYPVNSNPNNPSIPKKEKDLFSTIVDTSKNILKGLGDLLSGDSHKKTHILRVDSLKHEAYLKKIAIEINDIHDDLNRLRRFNFESKKLYDQTSKFMNDATTEFNQLNSLKDELENILNLNLTDLSHYLKEITELTKLVHSNNKELSKLLLKTNSIEITFKTFFPRINKIEDDIKLLSAKDTILFNSIGDINSGIKELSLESNSQKRDLKILYNDLLNIDERIKNESADLNEKNVLLEKKVEKMKVWIILLFGSILAFVILPTIFHLIASIWS